MPLPPISTLFPYTTLFRSKRGRRIQRNSHDLVEHVTIAMPAYARARIVAGKQHMDEILGPQTGERRGFCPDRFQPIRRSEEHTSELQSLRHLVCRLLLEKK